MHRLDLQHQEGALHGRHLDLPSSAKPDPGRFYLRQTERFWVPPSYRSGTAFFVTAMLLFMVGITGFDAHTLAQSRGNWLQAQLLQEFSRYQEQLQRPEELRDERLSDEEELRRLQQQALVIEQSPYWERSQQTRELVESGLALRQGFEAFQHFLDAWGSAEGIGLLERLNWMRLSGRRAYRFWHQVLEQPPELPEAQGSLQLIADLSGFLEDFEQYSPTLRHFLGAESPQRMVFLISDSSQQRPSAGALSVGLELLLVDGKVYSSRTFHVAEIDELQTFDLQPPLGLEDISERWNLSTANAFLDARDSSEQFHWFWQRQARSSLDLILTVSTDGLERFLNAGWSHPLGQQENGPEIENISLSWSARVANGQIEALKALAEQAVDRGVQIFANPDRFFQAWPTLQQLAQEKQLLLTATDPEQQNLLSEAGVSGELPDPPKQEDVLMVASLNQQRNGSDRWISSSQRLHTAIRRDGRIKHWLQINREHVWSSSQSNALREAIPFPLESGTLGQLTTTNRSLIRVMVPFGAELLGSNGVDLRQISTQHLPGYTIWSFPMVTRPGNRSRVELEYQLPWTFDTASVDNYRLHLLKQPGAKAASFSHQIKLPAELSIFQQLPEDPLRELDADQTLAVVAGKNPE